MSDGQQGSASMLAEYEWRRVRSREREGVTGAVSLARCPCIGMKDSKGWGYFGYSQSFADQTSASGRTETTRRQKNIQMERKVSAAVKKKKRGQMQKWKKECRACTALFAQQDSAVVV